MHSARTDGQPSPAGPRRGPFALFQRLNVRLFGVLAGSALVALVVSGIALSQILPDYFLNQARQRAEAALAATELAVTQLAEANPNAVTREQLEANVLRPSARFAAEISQATVEIHWPDGTLAARGDPTAILAASLRDQGLVPDAEVEPQSQELRTPLRFQPPIRFTYTVSQPYTSREATLRQVGEALVAGGVVALIVSLVIGMLGARVLTRPLARLRRTSSRLAQGQLDERAPRSNVLEVDELAQQFNVMADRLSESVRLLQADRDRLREFVADVSHELRTPIAALRTFIELTGDGEVSEEERREFQERSRQQISRLEWMSTNLLDLSRIDAGIFPLDVRPGDLRDPVRATVEAHSEIAEQRAVSLAFEVPTAPVMVAFDRERVVQLLTNLVGNALKFTPPGGEVVITLHDTPEAAMLEVRDTGPGIPADELPLIFDRFFRGTNVGEARASGSGLGLAIARSIVDMHSGEIGVVSAAGKGATFTIRLPRREQRSEQSQ